MGWSNIRETSVAGQFGVKNFENISVNSKEHINITVGKDLWLQALAPTEIFVVLIIGCLLLITAILVYKLRRY